MNKPPIKIEAEKFFQQQGIAVVETRRQLELAKLYGLKVVQDSIIFDSVEQYEEFKKWQENQK